MQEIIFFTRNVLSKTQSRRKHEYKSVLYLIMNKTISVQSFLIRSKFVFQKIDVKSCFVVNSVYTNNILNLMYKPFDCLREVMAFFLQTQNFYAQALNPRSLAPVSIKYNSLQTIFGNFIRQEPTNCTVYYWYALRITENSFLTKHKA